MAIAQGGWFVSIIRFNGLIRCGVGQLIPLIRAARIGVLECEFGKRNLLYDDVLDVYEVGLTRVGPAVICVYGVS
jgi:hypothetical protein